MEHSTNVLHTLPSGLRQLRDLSIDFAAMTHLQVKPRFRSACAKGMRVVVVPSSCVRVCMQPAMQPATSTATCRSGNST